MSNALVTFLANPLRGAATGAVLTIGASAMSGWYKLKTDPDNAEGALASAGGSVGGAIISALAYYFITMRYDSKLMFLRLGSPRWRRFGLMSYFLGPFLGIVVYGILGATASSGTAVQVSTTVAVSATALVAGLYAYHKLIEPFPSLLSIFYPWSSDSQTFSPNGLLQAMSPAGKGANWTVA
jgi:hypothetical protein